MSQDVEAFLTTIEEQEIVEAIRIAEKNTSGEIRVHLENTCNTPIELRALEVFSLLKMNNTKQKAIKLFKLAPSNPSWQSFNARPLNLGPSTPNPKP